MVPHTLMARQAVFCKFAVSTAFLPDYSLVCRSQIPILQNGQPPRAMFLTTCQDLWIVQRDGATNSLYMAPGTNINSASPSLAQSMAYLVLKFAEDAAPGVTRQRFPAACEPATLPVTQVPFSPTQPAPLRPMPLLQKQESLSRPDIQQDEPSPQHSLAIGRSLLGQGVSCVVRLGRCALAVAWHTTTSIAPYSLLFPCPPCRS